MIDYTYHLFFPDEACYGHALLGFKTKCKMKLKCLITILAVLLTVQLVDAICCERNRDCVISETCQEGGCGNCIMNIYNQDGTINVSDSSMTEVTSSTYIYNISKNLSVYGIYPYTINCTAGEYCRGDCQVEVKQECEEKEGMTTGVILFLLTLNVGIFITPLIVKRFSNNEVTNYIVRRMLYMAGIIFLWFNILILRVLAESFALGIDNFLEAYWWFFTLAMFIVIFSSMYFMVIGAINLSKQAVIRKRMGHEDGETRF